MAETQYRIAKTLETLRNHTLPTSPSSADNMFLESIEGTKCSGCCEPIRPRDAYYSVRLRDNTFMLLRLHPACYEFWIRFDTTEIDGSG